MHRFSLDLQQAAAWDEKVKDLTFSNGLEDIFKIIKCYFIPQDLRIKDE